MLDIAIIELKPWLVHFYFWSDLSLRYHLWLLLHWSRSIKFSLIPSICLGASNVGLLCSWFSRNIRKRGWTSNRFSRAHNLNQDANKFIIFADAKAKKKVSIIKTKQIPNKIFTYFVFSNTIHHPFFIAILYHCLHSKILFLFTISFDNYFQIGK